MLKGTWVVFFVFAVGPAEDAFGKAEQETDPTGIQRADRPTGTGQDWRL